jgi:hypothetical protein
VDNIESLFSAGFSGQGAPTGMAAQWISAVRWQGLRNAPETVAFVVFSVAGQIFFFIIGGFFTRSIP